MTDSGEGFDFDADDTEDSDTPSGNENSTIKAMRKQIRELKAQANRVPELETFYTETKAAQKETAITSAFEEVGLNPQHAKLYKALNPEVEVEQINAEAVASFAAEYSLIATSGEQVEAPAPKTQGYHPVTTGTAAPLSQFTNEDIEKMLSQGDIAGVEAAYESGRVERTDRPWHTQD